MDIKQAGETLQNIFAACEQEPNKVPFDKIVLRQKANTYPSLHILHRFPVYSYTFALP